MYKSTRNYITIGFLGILIERLSSLERKYSKSEPVQIILHYFISELRKDSVFVSVYNECPMHNSRPEDKEWNNKIPEPGKRDLLDMLNSVRLEMEPADFLQLKACLSEDDNEIKFLLQQAQMLNPEDILLYIIVNSFKYLDDADTENMYCIIRDCPIKPGIGKNKDFFDMVTFMAGFSKSPEKFPVGQLQDMLDRGPVFTGLLYTVLYDTKDTMVPLKMLKIIRQLNFPTRESKVQFELLKCILWHKAGEFLKALEILERTDIFLLRMEEWEQLEFLTLQAKLYQINGLSGKALLAWQSIIGNEDYRSSGCDFYFEAMLRLALAYMASGHFSDALKTLFTMGRPGIFVIIDLFGTEYYTLRGDICLAGNRKDKAVRMYNKALSLSDDPLLREKVKLVEMDLL